MREERLVFGEVAELYDRARPGYPEPLIDAVLRFSGAGVDELRALEVGSGTGKATVAFAARGVRVVALEPDPAMAAVGRRNCARFPGVRIEEAGFEEWPAPEGAFNLLFSAQAWHWLRPDLRYVKAARVLGTGGTIALLWHRTRWRDEPVRDELEAVYRRVAPDLYDQVGYPGLNPAKREADLAAETEATGLFEDITVLTQEWRGTFTEGSFVDLLLTQSHHRLLDEDERSELMDAVGGVVRAQGGEIVVPHVTHLVLARRGGPAPSPQPGGR